MKIVKKTAVALLMVFIAMQFYRPEKNQAQGNHTAQFLTETNPSSEVKIILQQTCYDCHSNSTEYPWYNNVAPVSYWLANHVKDGKKLLNFSDWESYSSEKKDHKLGDLVEMVEKSEMPLNEYMWTHGEAKLTEKRNSTAVIYCEGMYGFSRKAC